MDVGTWVLLFADEMDAGWDMEKATIEDDVALLLCDCETLALSVVVALALMVEAEDEDTESAVLLVVQLEAIEDETGADVLGGPEVPTSVVELGVGSRLVVPGWVEVEEVRIVEVVL